MATRIVRQPSKDMQKFLKAGTTGRLLGPLERFLDTEPAEFRRQDILHPSSMAKTDWCPKAGFLQLQRSDAGIAEPPEKINLIKRNIFDEGHYIHYKWQQRFWRQGVLYGKFTCRVCKTWWWDTSPDHCPSAVCSVKEQNLLKYSEVPLEIPALRIGGHSDGWVKDNKSDVMIEIKSVGLGSYRFDAQGLIERFGEDANELWKNTKRPFTSHINQGQIYLHLAHLLYGDEAPKDMVFIYEFKVNQQIREFCVPYAPDLVSERFEQAADIVDRLQNQDPAPECITGHFCAMCKRYQS